MSTSRSATLTSATPPVPATPATPAHVLRDRRRPLAWRGLRLGTSVVALHAGLFIGSRLRRDPILDLFAGREDDQFAFYERIRTGAENPLPVSATKLRYATSHAACSAVLKSRDMGAAPTDPKAQGNIDDNVDLSLLQLNPPDHARLRRVVAPAFSPRAMRRYGTDVEQITERLLSEVPAGEPWDLVEKLSGPLPMEMITRMLGIPDYDQPSFRRYGASIAAALDGVSSLRHAAGILAAQRATTDIFTRLFELRTREPSDDIISEMVQARDRGEIAPEDMVSLATLLLVAGFETTVNLIGSAVALLMERPGLWHDLTRDPNLAAPIIDETLRFAPPVHLTGRYPLHDTEVAGQRVAENEPIIVFMAAANRDPEVFERPDEFDITRTNPGDHLSFSAGAHYCLGAPLARLEATYALQALAQAAPTLRLAGRPVQKKGVVLRGPVSLPVIV